ncbi:MAG: glycoside hydrolase family 65 protein [Bacteroidales bacterium]|nr:glycoside hydrolase family 65 protein [Bacteroidales bacterium]
MNSHIKHNEWLIVEDGFDPENNLASESIFSLGNGQMGQRANFEEKYSGETLQGSYIAGVYYPDKTRVGWWKNGYPEYFAKVLNSTNWIGINVRIDDEELDLSTCRVLDFKKVLNMRDGYLERAFRAKLNSGKIVRIKAKRFLSIVDTEIGAIRYSVIPENFNGNINFEPYLDADVKNEDSNYNEKFWDEVSRHAGSGEGYVMVKTKKLDFHVCTGMRYLVEKNGKIQKVKPIVSDRKKYVANSIDVQVKKSDEIVIYKYASSLSTQNYTLENIMENAAEVLNKAIDKGFDNLLKEHAKAWIEKWKECDIVIGGDIAAQQGIRFNIFHLNQTYTGTDARLNIGPKGFTGEKYGGSTYWDTEAYALTFYLNTAGAKVARNLLLYRYKHLGKAIENAGKLGFKNGAALYPMVTMNGEECHNEWEITFEEIHRNGAIAYAIFNYINHTGDKTYMTDWGLEVLIGISRFWSQRVNFSANKNKYVILGVTGPNEYENNVNNNWYTNTIAVWTLEYTLEALNYVKNKTPDKYGKLLDKLNFNFEKETKHWKEIVQNMYFPYDNKQKIFLQQDGYLDKEQCVAEDIDPDIRPLNQHWSWDRILRSCFLKQADVLQGIYFFEDRYDIETIRRNFEYYESRTVHESSLSACIHSVLAAKAGDIDKAYELYLRTARLDLDDYNNEVAEGLHITSMAGAWMAIVEGFGGMRVRNGKPCFNPLIPEKWKNYSFSIKFRGRLLIINVRKNEVLIKNRSEKSVPVIVYGNEYELPGHGEKVFTKK